MRLYDDLVVVDLVIGPFISMEGVIVSDVVMSSSSFPH
jgi:hypothetical protein